MEKCTQRGIKYSKEPGFYQGSYYVTYGLSIGLFIIVWALSLLFLPNIGPIGTIILVVGVLILLTPLLFVLSKIIWANMFLTMKKETTIKYRNFTI